MANDSNDVREVQHKLRSVSAVDRRIPTISVDGIFGQETATAVREFQRVHGLPVTGDVDYATWKELDNAYLDTIRKSTRPAAVYIFPNNYALHLGDSGDIVYVLQGMLNIIAGEYTDHPRIAVTGTLDGPTVRSVKRIQNAARLPEDGVVDKSTWNSIARLVSGIDARTE